MATPGLNRRNLLSVLAGLTGLAACGLTQRRAFGGWADFKARFLNSDGRIIDTGNHGISHSEGQSYGMVMAAAARDRKAFMSVWTWTQSHLALKDTGLFAWRYIPNAERPVADPNNATDADLMIAWALHRAGEAFGSRDLTKASETVRASILRLCVRSHAGMSLLLPGLSGFETETGLTINGSYYIWPALKAFQLLDGTDIWGPVIEDGLGLHAKALFGEKHLPSDWIDIDMSGQVIPAPAHPARFGYDALRIPLYLKWAGFEDPLFPYQAFWNGYLDRHQSPPAWIDVQSQETASYPLSAGGTDLVAYVCNLRPGAKTALSSDYYASALTSLTALARFDQSRS